MTTRTVKAFEKEVNLTDEGISILVENKKSLVIEFNTKAGMTLARKERTERNKLIEQVKRVSIDTENAIKAKRATIIEQITDAYNCIVEPFEKEELRLKQEKERLAKIEEERIDAIRAKIGTIRNFSLGLTGKASQELSEIIEAVDMIDVEESFAEFTQEAMQVKKETLGELNITLSGAMQKEALVKEQEQLAAEKKAFDDEKAEFEKWKASQANQVEKVTEKVNEKLLSEQKVRPEYDEKELRLFFLECLIGAGVDNWSDGYDFAAEAFLKEYPGADLPR